ncbi:B-cell receptor CD22-like isoform X2 [Channa argus]|uniref:B-cell receptor CD22-like isoform X2 n=1 Tax=Channa argus TaxID=215402 RepID=UPI003521EDEA
MPKPHLHLFLVFVHSSLVLTSLKQHRKLRGATMSFNSGFVFLLSVSVIKGLNGCGVTYTSAHICAIKGSTVDIPCIYTNLCLTVKIIKKIWFTKGNDTAPVDLTRDPDYTGRVDYLFHKNNCTLRIRDLRESDSAVYKFTFIRNQLDLGFTGSPGVTLSVKDLQVKVIRSTFHQSYTKALLKCLSNSPIDQPIWFKNRQKLTELETASYTGQFYPQDNISCALKEHEDCRSPPVYAPQLPSVSVSPSAEIVEGSSVTLTCSSDANPAANYTWYKKDTNPNVQPLSKQPKLVFTSIQSSDSGEYYCKAQNTMGRKTSQYIFVHVKYPPQLPSVSVSPSAEIVEGSSVTLTCSSDANPAAKYTWYKKDTNPNVQPLSKQPKLVFSSIQSSDSGEYYCKARNTMGKKTSQYIFVHVKYPPQLPSVSVSPSAEIVEGSSVTLTCSSDANPAANYTWYKENEDSPKASGQIFTITDIRREHSGNYYCEAQNTRGRQNSTLHLAVVAGKSVMIMNIIRLTLVVLIPLFVLSLWMRKKKDLCFSTAPNETVEMIKTLVLIMRTSQH